MAADRRVESGPARAIFVIGTRLAAVLALLVVAFVASERRADKAEALFHFAHITEVMWGYGGDSSIQYIEISMDAGGQNLTTNSVLGAFDATGTYMLSAEFIVPSDVPQMAAGTKWTMASPGFAAASGTTPNFTFPAFAMPASGGQLCWGAPGVIPPAPGSWDHTVPNNYVDCVPYGTYSGAVRTGDSATTNVLGDGMFQSLNAVNNTGVTATDFGGVGALQCPTPQKGTGLVGFNHDNHIDLPPIKAYDDLTWPNSDLTGDGCGDTDDDNDGLSDATEAGLPGLACPSSTGTPSSIDGDSDDDRVLDGAECTLGTDPTMSGSTPPIGVCQASGDADVDGVFDSREMCYYNTSSTPVTGVNTDSEGMDDSCEITSINADMTVNVIDLQQTQQHTVQGGMGYLVNMDMNKDGQVNVIDLQYVAARSIPCP